MNRRTQREAGDVTSWALGVTAGLVLGVTLLIATPRLMAPATTAEETTTSATTRDAAAQAESAGAQEAASQGTAGQQEGGMQEGGMQQEGAAAEASAEGEGGAASGEAATEEAAGGAATEAAAGNAEAGQTVYVGNCAACHGPNGQGQIGPSLVGEDGPKGWTLAQFTATLREGKTPDRQLSAAMPRYAETQISDEQIADLQAYIKTLN
ncbi:c-type cytochrome [Deinococcus sp. ME38]|uniref:c-type cytochrome n=1 Tax=Deinococcus sp. ME38 TaxID=3400344 RepID=UPI003B5AFA2D